MISSLKKIVVATAAASSLLATAANAADIYQGGVVVPSASGVTFYGRNVQLSKSGINLNCNLSLDGDIAPDGSGGANIQVTGGNVTGGGLCGTVNLTNFPWTAHVDAADAPVPPENTLVPVTFNGITVQVPLLGTCGPGPVTAMYNNGASVPNTDASSFDFAATLNPGGCSITGKLSTQMPYSTEDVDVY